MDSCCVDARQSNRSFLSSKWLKDKELRVITSGIAGGLRKAPKRGQCDGSALQ